MTEESPWFFHAVKHGLDIEELKKYVFEKQIILTDEYGTYSGRGDSCQYFFDDDTMPYFCKIGKNVCDRNNIPWPDGMYIGNAWTVDGYNGSKHMMHTHRRRDGKLGLRPGGGLSVLIYLSLPEDMSNEKGWFFYVDKDGEWKYIKPELDTAFIFTQQVPHGTTEQAEGLRKTLNIEFLNDKEK